MLSKAKLPFCLTFLMISILLILNNSYANEEKNEDCFFCHKNLMLARYDEKGSIRNFYINKELYEKSTHGFKNCKVCHQDVNSAPHKEKIKKVDCAVECHLEEPINQKGVLLSHKQAAEKLNESVHNPGTRKDGKPRNYPDDVPACIYCHENTVDMTKLEGSELTKKEKKDLKKRDHIVVCLSCHSDAARMNRNALPSIEYLQDVLHFMKYISGNLKVPICMECHSPTGFNIHNIQSAWDRVSPLHKENREKTCIKSNCHTEPIENESFNRRVHNISIYNSEKSFKESSWNMDSITIKPGLWERIIEKTEKYFSPKKYSKKLKAQKLFDYYKEKSEKYKRKSKRFHIVDMQAEKVLGLDKYKETLECYHGKDHIDNSSSRGFRISKPLFIFLVILAVYLIIIFSLVLYIVIFLLIGMLYIKDKVFRKL